MTSPLSLARDCAPSHASGSVHLGAISIINENEKGIVHELATREFVPPTKVATLTLKAIKVNYIAPGFNNCKVDI
jgi:hypothetical protein